MFESPEERKLREMREIEMMMEQARYRTALQKLNEQRSGQSSTGTTGSAGGAAGGGSLLHKTETVAIDPSENGYVVTGYVDNYFV
jgi:hypothetical protein